jgi:hypothetical protein
MLTVKKSDVKKRKMNKYFERIFNEIFTRDKFVMDKRPPAANSQNLVIGE